MQTITGTYKGVELEITFSLGAPATQWEPAEGITVDEVEAVSIECVDGAADLLDPGACDRFEDDEELSEHLFALAEGWDFSDAAHDLAADHGR